MKRSYILFALITALLCSITIPAFAQTPLNDANFDAYFTKYFLGKWAPAIKKARTDGEKRVLDSMNALMKSHPTTAATGNGVDSAWVTKYVKKHTVELNGPAMSKINRRIDTVRNDVGNLRASNDTIWSVLLQHRSMINAVNDSISSMKIQASKYFANNNSRVSSHQMDSIREKIKELQKEENELIRKYAEACKKNDVPCDINDED